MIITSINDVDVFIKKFFNKIEYDLVYPLSVNQKFFSNKTKKNNYIYELTSVKFLKNFSHKVHDLQQDNAILFNDIVQYLNSNHSSIGINFFKQLFMNAFSSISSQEKNAFQQSYVYLHVLNASIKYLPVNLDYKTNLGETALHHLAYVVHAIASQHDLLHAESVELRDRCGNECSDRLVICNQIFQSLSRKAVFYSDLSKYRLLDILTSDAFVLNKQNNSAIDILLDINKSYLEKFLYGEATKWNPERFFIIDFLLGRYSYLTLKNLYQKKLDMLISEDSNCEYHRSMFLEKLEFFKKRLFSPIVREQRKKHLLRKIDFIEDELMNKKSIIFDKNILNMIINYAGQGSGSKASFLKVEQDFFVQNPNNLNNLFDYYNSLINSMTENLNRDFSDPLDFYFFRKRKCVKLIEDWKEISEKKEVLESDNEKNALISKVIDFGEKFSPIDPLLFLMPTVYSELDTGEVKLNFEEELKISFEEGLKKGDKLKDIRRKSRG
jgi:hypothetical protein